MRRVLTFPPLIALVLALLLRPIALPAVLDDLFARLGATVAPVALLAVGAQLQLGALRGRLRALALGLGYKLLLGPLLIAAAGLAVLQPDATGVSLALTVIVFEAAMGPMIGAAVVAQHYKLDTQITALMIGIGIPLSLAVAPLWLLAMRSLA